MGCGIGRRGVARRLAPRSFAEGSYGQYAGPDLGELARTAYVRPAHYAESYYQYARYEPETLRAFRHLTWKCAAGIWPGAAVPYDTEDVQAFELLNRIDGLNREMVERSTAKKKFRPLLERVPVPTRWACLAGVCYENPAYFLLAEDDAIATRVRAFHRERDDRHLDEAW